MYEYLVKIYGIFLSPEYIVNAVKRPPNYLRNSFYQSHSNIILERKFVLLGQFDKCSA